MRRETHMSRTEQNYAPTSQQIGLVQKGGVRPPALPARLPPEPSKPEAQLLLSVQGCQNRIQYVDLSVLSKYCLSRYAWDGLVSGMCSDPSPIRARRYTWKRTARHELGADMNTYGFCISYRLDYRRLAPRSRLARSKTGQVRGQSAVAHLPGHSFGSCSAAGFA